MTKNKKGFTLIELMIVVAIIGILAAIAIPNFIKFQAKGKQAEANSNLKAVFSAQKATFSPNNGYWSDIGAIGFQPERGNRYLYDLGASSVTVAAGAQGACAQLQMRDVALLMLTAGDCGVGVDSARHGAQFIDATILGLATTGTATFVTESTNMVLVATMAGVNGVDCPNCDFAARAKSNVDNDVVADEWWISSQTIETAAVVGCPPAMTVANMTAYTSGSPAPTNDDVCAQ
ncbi:MAG: prepilin-type N-terminal cleavage/methylation domain-containing protein [Myxococcales bacterium]|nr:prepilin-type N-terminal cleavage/methylation domain-containing protein [Myxococcales bacterium]